MIMSKHECRIFLIDDDEAIRYGISMLLSSAGYLVECFSNAEEFLETETIDISGCILLDIFLEGRSGLELQEQIRCKFGHLPVIYITGQGDIPMSVRALRNGALNFLQKPIDEADLLTALKEAIDLSCKLLSEKNQITMTRSLFERLTPRETEILRYIVSGRMNKQIAAELNITEQTVKVHRGRITEKLGVRSVAELVQMAAKTRFL
jgi:FixJ family two-component response regulator